MNRALAIVIAAAVLAGCRREDSRPPVEQPTPVKVQRPQRVHRPAYVSVSGTVEPKETVDLGFQVGGRVVSVNVEEGQRVRRGQVLAQLDATDYRYGLEAAEAQAGVAKANLDKAQNGTRAEELEQARINFERARDDYERYRQLHERKSMAPADFAKVEAGYKASRAQYDMARNGARAEDQSAARSAVDQARAQVGVSRKRVADTRLTAPISGVVARRAVDPGEIAAPGMPVFTIIDLDPARIRSGIPESDIGRVHVGQRATVVVPALGGTEFEGTVALTGVAADPSSRTFTAKIDVPNPHQVLRAGMITESRIRGSEQIDVLTLPGDAIVRDAQGATLVYVYFPDKKRVYARRVEAGGVRGRDVEVRSGLTGEEMVVVAGQQKLREGSVVEVTR